MISKEYISLGPKKLAEKMGVEDSQCLMNRAYHLGVKTDRKFHWTPELDSIIIENFRGIGLKETAKLIGASTDAVFGRAVKLGIRSSRKRPPQGFQWTDDKVQAIKDRYVKEGARSLAAQFDVAPDTIRGKAVELGLHTKAGYKISGQVSAELADHVNVNYFKTWSRNMAYILGFM